MTHLAKIIITAALVAALLLISAGPGTRLDLWEFRFGFTLMRWAVYLGGASAVVALLALLLPKFRRGNAGVLCLAVAIGATTAALPYMQMQKARSVPRIHDITTDFTNPPSFEAVLPLRANAPNPPEYQGEEIAQQQREAYPDIQPLVVQADATSVFATALASARQQGWEIVAADADRGLIEATETTFWFGFKDDVVIRLTTEGEAVRVDIRSKSRVGLSDVGANAERIRRFSKTFKQRLS